MKFAHIAPPRYVRLLDNRGYHLIVANRVLEDQEYANFWRMMGRRGHFIIVDNGEVEVNLSKECEPISFETVVKVAEYVHASEICLPDVWKDGTATIDKVEQHVLRVTPQKRMVIPQGTNGNEWINCLEALMQWRINSVGIPKHCETFPGGRYELCKAIEEHGQETFAEYHLLGIWDNPEEEIVPIARNFPWVRGIDSGIAFAYAQREACIYNYEGEHVGLDWNKRCNVRQSKWNMEVLEEWAHGESTPS